jgi:predicted metal-dependent phosphoesterase TrpH
VNRYDLQVHTDASPCSRASPRSVVEAASNAGLDGIAITNHDTLEGYEAARSLAPADLTVIPGVEVTTTQGHLLALDVETAPPRTDPLSVVSAVHDQDGLAILSHPFDGLREHFTANLEDLAAAVDGVEVLNSRCILPRYNRRALAFARRHDLPMTGGSDAHFPMELGRAYTSCEGPILESIRSGTTRTGGRGGYLSGHVATKVNDALAHLQR